MPRVCRSGHRLAVAGQALGQHLVVDVVGCGHQRHAGHLQRVDAGQQVVGEQRHVLDALAVELHQELFDLPAPLPILVQRNADQPSGAVIALLVRPVYSPWMSK
jgi:hypothetical protein